MYCLATVNMTLSVASTRYPGCVIRNHGEMFALFECCEFDGQNCWSVCVLIFGPSQLVQEGAQGRARVKDLSRGSRCSYGGLITAPLYSRFQKPVPYRTEEDC
jgi:hypothetical protein